MKIPIIHWTLEYSLHVLGLWPNKPILISQLLIYSSLVGISPFQIKDIYAIYEDKPKMVDGVRNTVAIILIVIKFGIMRYNKGNLHSLLIEVEDDWKNMKNPQDKEIMMKYLKYAYKFCICVWTLYSAVGISYGLECFYGFFANEKVLLIPVAYPFDLNFTPYFLSALIFQSILYAMWLFANGLSESLLGTLIFHLVGKIEILLKDISEISFRSTSSCDNKYLIMLIKNIVLKHRRLILMHHKIESIYCYICLTQFLGSIIVLCLAGFLIITFEYEGALDVFEIMKNIIYILLNLSQAFAFCFSGEILLSQSSNIPQCISDCSWYETSPGNIKLLLMVILRTQKPLALTVGKFTELSIGSFTRILQTAVSYLSVLRTRY
ncbi:odorant receptor 4-like [Leptopilina boulardi]|uniref:odorant receptor 4-like n=1 Tax=Leptopilina boulardi TaxID=63433 RepID=UPI0021F63793|nr:odorant receptor 4-like [Leptopilina boulardi]